jgi:hypothetical protein
MPMWPLVSASDRSELARERSCSLEFHTFVTTTYISVSLVMTPCCLPHKQGCIGFTEIKWSAQKFYRNKVVGSKFYRNKVVGSKFYRNKVVGSKFYINNVVGSV